MHRVWAAIVEHFDPRISGQLVPVGSVLFIPEVCSGLFDHLGLLVAKHHQPGQDVGRGIYVGDFLVGVGVASAHEAASQHADADFLAIAGAYLVCRHKTDP